MFWAKFQLRELASILFNLLETISEGAIPPYILLKAFVCKYGFSPDASLSLKVVSRGWWWVVTTTAFGTILIASLLTRYTRPASIRSKLFRSKLPRVLITLYLVDIK